ncbi:hypothetical protein GCM10018793_15900 [Streptomyces sulfonofaciens]|uniref:Uncharacterized protein n=1 Tax=Streptomyces sulfonofaciens TaxID=68272 RepID=A0A919FYW2_9ACTN|nr:hypothetical protein [Streptomyces sulfonofaciens]GHH74508.1 hypothetical protein GCM10018793_15900 [Streptomyces sulfonofaciens]
MQAAPARSTALPSVTAALRALESLLMAPGQRTARRNAWNSVLEDRRRAKDRIEAERVLDKLGELHETPANPVRAAVRTS